MTGIGAILLGVGFIAPLYAYLGYPALLALFARRRALHGTADPDAADWPPISIAVAAYNEERAIADSLESLLALDYPDERREVVVISDGSTDRTDEIVTGFAERGVRLFRTGERCGKTEAENRAAPTLTGDIIVNTDATIRFPAGSLKPLIRPFEDPAVGLASGRDVSVSPGEDPNLGESGYVGYEMWVRALETRVGGIVGASGCFYATRAELHRRPVPGALSRDFAAALKSHEAGFRSVSVDDALCFVPRQRSLHREYRRKVRTMARGIATLRHWSGLLNPLRHPVFAWKLFSHKVMRWFVPWAGLGAAFGLVLLSGEHAYARWALWAGLGLTALAGLAWAIADRIRLPGILGMAAFALMGNVAAIHAILRLLSGANTAMWEPTRRTGSGPASS